MEYIKINRLHEEDFDEIITKAGGSRIVADGNADYFLNEAIIELKLITEEGLDKGDRRRKVAELFVESQLHKPVVVLDTSTLNEKNKRKYYNLMEKPIKTHVKKGRDQLNQTLKNVGESRIRVLLAINNGYTALNIDEFESVVLKCVRNDTTKIDYVIVGGIYYYSDRFDNYFFTPFELFPVNITFPFSSFDNLKNSWHNYIEKCMTSYIFGKQASSDDRLPVIDLKYEIEGITFIKPTPPIGKPSSFWPEGKRPRGNSSGIDKLPPVAKTFPGLNSQNWQLFKKAFPHEKLLQDSYSSWLSWVEEEAKRPTKKLQLFVKVEIDFHECEEWCTRQYENWEFSEICQYANSVFDKKAKEIMCQAIPKSDSKLLIPRYIYLITEEIGQDKANDMSSIYYVSELPGFERTEILLKNERIFFEHALALAVAFAIKMKIDAVMYVKDQTYLWT